MISIILIEPETPGNIGAIARVMKNFDFDNLVLIDPKCSHLAKEAMDRATHAKDILQKAKIETKSHLKTYDYLIATTSKLGTDYNIPRSPITPEQLAKKLSRTERKVGLVFGREGNGLSNEEIDSCDFTVTIPSSRAFSALNLSHAVAIMLYEISKKISKNQVNNHIIEATKKEKKVMMDYFNKIFDKLEFATKEKKQTQKIIWKRIIGKSFMTRREAFAAIGLLRKILNMR